jgi:hypothetical protein
MIWFFTPYSFEKRMFEAWDRYMDLVTNPDDWVCMMDGDVMFLEADFGHHIQKYIDKFPDTGIFSCYVSRSRTAWMMPEQNLFNNPSIIDHKKKADYLRHICGISVKEINDRVTGHLMVIQKSTWTHIREEVENQCLDLNILSVDSVISRMTLQFGYRIRLMRSLYVLHYYRFLEGPTYKKHLQ